ncbi:hypothetical protein IQ241_06460 [Romeria aff. gracilis LEGE 07310]|uniref:Uncharacterized protein n=1 Tax=Vasconcelosia minhoensis LEGE 07310 TaxID=915328 RepID=A0A8J7DMM1_9CYAN|nr:hypothetical protein [Romeria gracilis]MBE9076940.1 hypothetical protein [Romeria aff. gracilis LEGE 07310]
MTDLGINTYRIYGGMSRWETEDDDGRYGLPTIAQIKADPDVIPWERWDRVMTQPKAGTDYAFSGVPTELWQGSARTIFETLKRADIRPVLTIRNTDPGWNPDWALELNPPRTEADWNEWWEHVFATIYWLNVRNDYRVDDFEIHNEPDNRQQGWGGSRNDYFKLVQVAHDVADFVYSTYLPGRDYHIHAPVTTGESSWVSDALQTIPDFFDSVNIHNYAENIAVYTQQVRQWMQGTLHADSPIWLGEWGTYTTGYDDLAFSLSLLKNLIRAAQPGAAHIYGSHIFSLYDWGQGEDGFAGLINARGEHRFSYYAFRMGIRALQGGQTVLSTEFSQNDDLTAIATKSTPETIYLLVVNEGSLTYDLTANISTLLTEGTGTVWQLSDQIADETISSQPFQAGRLPISVPTQSAILVEFTAI